MSIRIVIFRHSLGAFSEPFIWRQAQYFPKGSVTLASVKTGSPLEGTPSYALNDGSLRGWGEDMFFRLFRRSRRLEKALVADGPPDVILAHFVTDAWRIASVAKRIGVPLVAVAHGSDVLMKDQYAGRLGWSGRQLARNWKRAAIDIDLFLPVSDFLSRALRRRGIPASKIKRHYLGVEVDGDIQIAGVDRARWDIIFVGRLESNKGCAQLIDALPRVASRRPDLRVLVLGEGSQRSILEERSRSLGINGLQIVFKGAVPPDQVRSYMLESSLLCSPSVERADGISEGFGLAALEAQACGLPVVVSRTGGLPEACIDGVSGLVTSPGNSAELGDAIGRLLADPDLRREMGASGRQWVQADMNIRTQTLALYDLLEQQFCAPRERRQ